LLSFGEKQEFGVVEIWRRTDGPEDPVGIDIGMLLYTDCGDSRILRNVFTFLPFWRPTGRKTVIFIALAINEVTESIT